MNKNGFTLIELIASIAILSVILLGGYSVLISSHVDIIKYGDKTESTFETESLVEQYRNGDVVTEATPTDATVEITIGSESFDIEGQLVEVEVPSVDLHGSTTTILQIFVPD